MSPPPAGGSRRDARTVSRQSFRLFPRRVELGGKERSAGAQPLYGNLAGSRGRREGYVLRTSGEPLNLLELDVVPGRVADDGVEAALRVVVLPSGPDAGERGLPVQEALALRDGLGLAPQVGERRRGRSPVRDPPPRQ